MRFASPYSTLAALALLLTGCAMGPQQDQPTAPETGAQADAKEGAAQEAFNKVLPPGPITDNPYNRGPAPQVPDAARSDFERAKDLMSQGEWGEARHLLQDLVVRVPALSGPWLNLGIVWTQLDEPGQARAAFERALNANPKNVDAYNHLAALERRAGHFDKAEQLYRQALDVWPHSAASHRNLGILLDLYIGEWQEALLHYRACQHIITQTEGEADATLNGWIIDLERRIKAREGQS